LISLRQRSLALLAALAASVSGLAVAQGNPAEGFPARPIRLLVPYAPGGGTDIVMRAIAPGMGEALGQTIVVENRPGGGTINATQAAVLSAPDGYTLLAVGAPIYLNAALGTKTPYDPLKDLQPLSLLVNNPGLLLVNPASPATTVKELIALSQAQKGGLNYATAGIGSFGHLGMELLKSRLGMDARHIPYNGSAPALADLMGGQVPLALDAIIPSGAQAKTGKVRALAILADKRSPLLPDVPTLAEAGFPGIAMGATFGLMLPANTPTAIVAKLHAATMKAIHEPATQRRLEAMGYQIVADTPEQFADYLRRQIATWTRIVKDNNIKAD
jgi:tripartite-type tricarboxylate transporter receptor subunit TctC